MNPGEVSGLAGDRTLPKTGSVCIILPKIGYVKQVDNNFPRFGDFVENEPSQFV